MNIDDDSCQIKDSQSVIWVSLEVQLLLSGQNSLKKSKFFVIYLRMWIKLPE